MHFNLLRLAFFEVHAIEHEHMASLSLEIFDAKKADYRIITLENVSPEDTIFSIKRRIAQQRRSLLVERQSLRLDAKGKSLKDEQRIDELNLPTKGAQLFLKDLGPQVAWKTVFLAEYTGPLLIYPLFYFRPAIFYGARASSMPMALPVTLALVCWSIHYAKRLCETQFVHRFSNSTMPRFNLFKNCGYYWGFCAFVSYFINHPLYTSPSFGTVQIFGGLIGFAFCEFGNLSIHLLLRDLRPEGSKERRIPLPNSNPLTRLFDFVSCPNYTYEVGSWLSFSIMVQSLPALLFTIAGFVQMAIWAKNKHRAYIKEFVKYPRGRKAIVPFLL
uniref:very-long-chain enoyl-CoA reductase n=1 Tax=Parascaris univalens TaxID=6257 RepID=A0A915BI86_PARUN